MEDVGSMGMENTAFAQTETIVHASPYWTATDGPERRMPDGGTTEKWH